jgi:hypothetical protein
MIRDRESLSHAVRQALSQPLHCGAIADESCYYDEFLIMTSAKRASFGVAYDWEGQTEDPVPGASETEHLDRGTLRTRNQKLWNRMSNAGRESSLSCTAGEISLALCASWIQLTEYLVFSILCSLK